MWNPALLGFDCRACSARVDPDDVGRHPVCPSCGQPLVATYDTDAIGTRVRRDALDRFGHDLWRYRFALPFSDAVEPVRLGEGGTPLLPVPALARAHGLSGVWLKDEAPNATQSFKARGLALAVTGALALGRRAIALPSAGNAGSAAAAYAAAAGLRCRVTLPEETPEAFVIEQEALGAELRRVPGTIADAGRELLTWAPPPEWWNVATFREPFRLEGKKTLGYEIAEQLGWRLPEWILYPTGGGTGLVGMWRAFAELRALGWVTEPSPRLVAVQVEGCAPIVRAFDRGEARAAPWPDAQTLASGLRVPSPFADALILAGVRETGGRAVSVTEDAMLDGMAELAARAGCFACPEGGATLAALESLSVQGVIAAGARVVLFNTGSGLKYLEAWRRAAARRALAHAASPASSRSKGEDS
jgi:threonine synthase